MPMLYKKRINLLHDVFDRPQHSFKQTRVFSIVIVGAILLTISVIGIIGTNFLLKREKLRQQGLIEQINANRNKIETLYNISIRQQLAEQIEQQRYVPSKVILFFNELVTPDAFIHSYQITSGGQLTLRLLSDNALNAAKVWFYLASNKHIITSLNLQSFTYEEDTDRINFSLRGEINLEQIYQLYGLKQQ